MAGSPEDPFAALAYSLMTRRDALGSVLRTAARMLALGCTGPVTGLLGTDLHRAVFGPLNSRTTHRVSSWRQAVDPHRLPTHVLPERYELRLEPDLLAFTFTGTETVTVTVREPTSDILLNAAELHITDASIASEGGRAFPGTVELQEAAERCRIGFPHPLKPGTWRLRLSFTGTLNDKLRGFYRSSYKDRSGSAHMLAATQFEATDARRAFPCWDEPAFKSVFAATLVIDPSLTAVSNTPIASEWLEDGKKVVQFKDTIRMSTYLLAFIVGELEATEPVLVGRTPVRIWAVRGKRHLASFGQKIAAFSLRFFEEYYGLPYPAEKLDLLAVPDFASGAMENLGAITFRETALLVDEQTATHGELERVADVVAHENAHMWFGDLVTMAWWNGLWLNEAFATFMEMLAVDAWKPEWQRWTTFGVSRAAALSVDGLHSSRPIEYPVQVPREADAMFDVLTYEKGASVLRMLEQHLGPEVFRDGIRGYLRAHAYANADTGDLWAALERVAKQPVPTVMNGWIFRPGYPLIHVGLDRQSRLVLSQRRFTYLQAAQADAAEESETAQLWQVPLQIRIAAQGTSRTQRVLLTEAQSRLDLPKEFDSILVNEGGHGFYRAQYAPELLERLLRLLPDGLTAIERFNLLNDAWAGAVAGLMPLTGYLDLTGRFKAERDRNVWAIVIESLHLLNRIITPADRPGLEALVRDRLGPAMAELGWNPRSGENELTRQLRADLIRALGTIGNDRAVQARAAELYEEFTAATAADRAAAPAMAHASSIDPNVFTALIGILAHVGDAARYDAFSQRFHSAATPQEERRYLFALTSFWPPTLVERTLARTIDGEIRTQDAPFIVQSLLMQVHAREEAWAFVKRNWDTMDRLYPKSGLRRMCGGVIGLATPELERDVQTFFAERKIDLGGKTLAQYLEQLRIAVSFRTREGTALSGYLARAASRL